MSQDKLREALDLLNQVNTIGCNDSDSGRIVQARMKLNEALAASKPEQASWKCVAPPCMCDVSNFKRCCFSATPTAEPAAPVAAKPDPAFKLTHIHTADVDRARRDALDASKTVVAAKPGQQAQAEPEVVKHQFQLGSGTWVDFENAEHFKRVKESGACPIRELITLQSHREAMARVAKRHVLESSRLHEAISQRDAALDACVEARNEVTSIWSDMRTCERPSAAFALLEGKLSSALDRLDAAITEAQEARKS